MSAHRKCSRNADILRCQYQGKHAFGFDPGGKFKLYGLEVNGGRGGLVELDLSLVWISASVFLAIPFLRFLTNLSVTFGGHICIAGRYSCERVGQNVRWSTFQECLWLQSGLVFIMMLPT
uniref:Transmembrane protein n=1 Tax=Steinernema glaseri TaxID=37863 RepID=A0A1I7YMH8_9BILA